MSTFGKTDKTVAAPTPSSTTATTTAAMDQAAQAAVSLQLLLREDRLLVEHGLVETSHATKDADDDNASTPTASAASESVAFRYAAALLQQQQETSDNGVSSQKEAADAARQEVERKLALVESLAVKLSRTSPEAVAGHLLRLHGYPAPSSSATTNSTDTPADAANNNAALATTMATTSLQTLRDRADRLERQSAVLESVAQRAQASLQKGHQRLSGACRRLERVLAVSQALKRIWQWQFEYAKLKSLQIASSAASPTQEMSWSLAATTTTGSSDLRDLVRAAASVAVLEDLQAQLDQEQQELEDKQQQNHSIAWVDRRRPHVEQTAAAVRRAAGQLLESAASASSDTAAAAAAPLFGSTNRLQQLGAALQVYYSLGELPKAVWQAVETAHAQARQYAQEHLVAGTLAALPDQARKAAQQAASSTSSSSSTSGAAGSGAHQTHQQQIQHLTRKKLAHMRRQLAQGWIQGLSQAALSVKQLERVLVRKSDPYSRRAFGHVVAMAEIPEAYRQPPNSSLAAMVAAAATGATSFPLLALFWARLCQTLAHDVLEPLLQGSNNAKPADVAGLYPALRSVTQELVGQLVETAGVSSVSSSASTTMWWDESSAALPRPAGILGGSSALDSVLFPSSSLLDTAGGKSVGNKTSAAENPQAAATVWTRPAVSAASTTGAGGSSTTSWGLPFSSLILQSAEWQMLESNGKEQVGLYPLQQAFVKACTDRLCAPLNYMFPEDIPLVDDGVTTPPTSSVGTPGSNLLPSKYDVQRFEENIRQELALADPKEGGGGDFSIVTMITGCVVNTISVFCRRARSTIHGGPLRGDQTYLTGSMVGDPEWALSEVLQHDRKVAIIMYTLSNYLQAAPEKTFVAPYRPATSVQHEEAANLCLRSLHPALEEINAMVKYNILDSLTRAIRQRLGVLIAKMHLGVYRTDEGGLDDTGGGFVQATLGPSYERIAELILAKFPPPYASILASAIASYSIYAFVSNIALIRPLGESARLHMTQDLADLELSLEQVILKGGNFGVLSQIEEGKPYAELRAVRQMLFWNGGVLSSNRSKTGAEIARTLLREAWIKDVRPSTIFHYLFSFSPSLLSSPHHVKRIKAEDYVDQYLVPAGQGRDPSKSGSSDAPGATSIETSSGEDDAWMVVLASCDAYQQRASSTGMYGLSGNEGDPRVAEVLLSLGPELLRRRQN